MLDKRLGRHSTVVGSLGLIPALVVIAVLADGIANPGVSHSRALVLIVLSIPPATAVVLGRLNGYSVLRTVVMAGAALLMIGAWYAVLFLPAAAICSATQGGSCM